MDKNFEQKFGVKNRNFARNFDQKSKFLRKIEILTKNRNFNKNRNFAQNIEILTKNRNFDQKSKF